MQVQLNSDKNIVGSPGLQEHVQALLEQELKHLAKEITRVEVHLNDANSSKSGSDDKRCMLEARVARMQPISVEHRAATVDLAINGAAEQLSRAVKNSLEKLDTNAKRRVSIKHMDHDQASDQ
jgi:ribosome-associated translation inhibitor RaiA